ncbi:MAG: hypothetical protein H7833_00480 [Magnetococcus sp. DMHC-1]
MGGLLNFAQGFTSALPGTMLEGWKQSVLAQREERLARLKLEGEKASEERQGLLKSQLVTQEYGEKERLQNQELAARKEIAGMKYGGQQKKDAGKILQTQDNVIVVNPDGTAKPVTYQDGTPVAGKQNQGLLPRDPEKFAQDDNGNYYLFQGQKANPVLLPDGKPFRATGLLNSEKKEEPKPLSAKDDMLVLRAANAQAMLEVGMDPKTNMINSQPASQEQLKQIQDRAVQIYSAATRGQGSLLQTVGQSPQSPPSAMGTKPPMPGARWSEKRKAWFVEQGDGWHQIVP